MLKKKEAFLRILCIELEDLEEDINLLIKECEEKHCKEEISNYVFLENLVVFKNELFGVESFLKDVKDTRLHQFETVDDLLNGLLSKLKERVLEKGIAQSVINLIERKMNKVKVYIEH